MTHTLEHRERTGRISRLVRPSQMVRPGSDFLAGVDHAMATLAHEVIGHYHAAIDARERAAHPDAEGQPPEVVDHLAAGHEKEAEAEHRRYVEGMSVLYRLCCQLDAQCGHPRYRPVYEEAFQATLHDADLER